MPFSIPKNTADIFTLWLLLQYVIAASLYLREWNLNKALYWIGATLLTIAVLRMKSP